MKAFIKIEVLYSLPAFWAGERGRAVPATLADAWRIAREKSANFAGAVILVNGEEHATFCNGRREAILATALELATR